MIEVEEGQRDAAVQVVVGLARARFEADRRMLQLLGVLQLTPRFAAGVVPVLERGEELEPGFTEMVESYLGETLKAMN